jgi:hypothetical protein
MKKGRIKMDYMHITKSPLALLPGTSVASSDTWMEEACQGRNGAHPKVSDPVVER